MIPTIGYLDSIRDQDIKSLLHYSISIFSRNKRVSCARTLPGWKTQKISGYQARHQEGIYRRRSRSLLRDNHP